MKSPATSSADKAHQIRRELLAAIADAQTAKSNLDVRVENFRVTTPEYAKHRKAVERVSDLHEAYNKAVAALRAEQNVG